MHTAILMLGSNIDAEQNIPRAVQFLAEQLTVLKTSSVWQSEAADCCYPDYLNLGLLISTPVDATQLKDDILRPLEEQLGRVRTADKNASRTIDIDILIFDEVVLDATLWEQVYLAVPLAEISQSYVSPGGETIVEAARRLVETVPLRRREDVLITLPPH